MSKSIELGLASEVEVAGSIRVVMRQYFSSHMLSSAARLAELARRIEEDHSGQSRFDLEHRAYVLSSVLSSVGFLEAMVNELFQDAFDGHAPEGGAITPLSTDTRHLMAEYWRSMKLGERGRILDKYQALLRFAGQPVMEEGAQPYQD